MIYKGYLVLVGGLSLKTNRTNYIENYILNLTGKKNPNILFIPFATNTDDGCYGINKVIKRYSKIGDYNIDQVKYSDLDNIKLCEKKINDSDIIYIGGGYTLKLLNALKKNNFYKLIINSLNSKVVVGRSAGAIIFFDKLLSESIKNENNIRCYKGLGIIPGIIGTAHFSEFGEQEILRKYIKTKKLNGIGLDENVVMLLNNNTFRVISNDNHSNAWFYRRDRNGINELKIKKNIIYNIKLLNYYE